MSKRTKSKSLLPLSSLILQLHVQMGGVGLGSPGSIEPIASRHTERSKVVSTSYYPGYNRIDVPFEDKLSRAKLLPMLLPVSPPVLHTRWWSYYSCRQTCPAKDGHWHCAVNRGLLRMLRGGKAKVRFSRVSLVTSRARPKFLDCGCHHDATIATTNKRMLYVIWSYIYCHYNGIIWYIKVLDTRRVDTQELGLTFFSHWIRS